MAVTPSQVSESVPLHTPVGDWVVVSVVLSVVPLQAVASSVATPAPTHPMSLSGGMRMMSGSPVKPWRCSHAEAGTCCETD